jgi:peptidoglycan/xylan/chitin deacetylase (PgdA/CDA1 family)
MIRLVAPWMALLACGIVFATEPDSPAEPVVPVPPPTVPEEVVDPEVPPSGGSSEQAPRSADEVVEANETEAVPADPQGVPTDAADAAPPEEPSDASAAPQAHPRDDGTRVAVLGYHDFSETLPETEMRLRTSKFRKQMETIRLLGLTVVSMEDFSSWKRGEKDIPKKSVVLTFDDGWKSVYTDAVPVLREFGYPYTIYLYRNYVDGGGKAMTSEMIRELVRDGAVIGSHSTSHPYPATVRKQQAQGPEVYDAFLRKEMADSKAFLESRFGVTVATYAYPGGFSTPEMPLLGRELGYHHFFTVLPGKITRATPDDALPRYVILGTHDSIFENATTFRDSDEDAPPVPAGAIAGMIQTLPHAVSPEPGALVNDRRPEIRIDVSKVPDLDPATLVMHVSGFGEVPATLDRASGTFAWKVNRRLRHPTCQVSVSWRNTSGVAAAPLRWAFRIDRDAAYLAD